MKLPHGSRKSLPLPEELDARLARRGQRGLPVVDDEAEMPVVVPLLRTPLCQREELVAHADEGHAGDARLHLDVEDAPVELERLVEVADLESDVIDPDQPGAVHHVPIVPASGLATTGG